MRNLEANPKLKAKSNRIIVMTQQKPKKKKIILSFSNTSTNRNVATNFKTIFNIQICT